MLQPTYRSSQRFRTESLTELSLDFDFWLVSDLIDVGYALDAPMYIPLGGQRAINELKISTDFVHREHFSRKAAA